MVSKNIATVMDILSQNTFLQNWYSTNLCKKWAEIRQLSLCVTFYLQNLGECFADIAANLLLGLQIVIVFVFSFLFLFLLFSCLQIIGRETANLWR